MELSLRRGPASDTQTRQRARELFFHLGDERRFADVPAPASTQPRAAAMRAPHRWPARRTRCQLRRTRASQGCAERCASVVGPGLRAAVELLQRPMIMFATCASSGAPVARSSMRMRLASGRRRCSARCWMPPPTPPRSRGRDGISAARSSRSPQRAGRGSAAASSSRARRLSSANRMSARPESSRRRTPSAGSRAPASSADARRRSARARASTPRLNRGVPPRGARHAGA